MNDNCEIDVSTVCIQFIYGERIVIKDVIAIDNKGFCLHIKTETEYYTINLKQVLYHKVNIPQYESTKLRGVI